MQPTRSTSTRFSKESPISENRWKIILVRASSWNKYMKWKFCCHSVDLYSCVVSLSLVLNILILWYGFIEFDTCCRNRYANVSFNSNRQQDLRAKTIRKNQRSFHRQFYIGILQCSSLPQEKTIVWLLGSQPCSCCWELLGDNHILTVCSQNEKSMDHFKYNAALTRS